MSQERAELNWYHDPPDYFSVRDRSTRASAQDESQQTHSAQQVRAGPDHDTAAGTFTFDDFLDIINPLHHLPLISSIYREVTGDQISAHARILGGGLYGGGSGFVAAIANAISEEATGRDLGDNLVAALFGDDETGSDSVAAGSAPRAAPSTGATAAALEAGYATPAPSGQAAEAVPAAAQAPPEATTEPPLEGEAALAALFTDLRSAAQGAVTGPVESAPVPSAPTLRTAGSTSAAPASAAEPNRGPAPSSIGPATAGGSPGGIAVDPALFAARSEPASKTGQASHPGRAFTDQMLLGLQKYDEMMSRQPPKQAGIETTIEPGG